MPTDAPQDLLIGQVLAEKYAIEALIARGGMGSVYRAYHIQSGHTFAVKVLRPELCQDITLVKRFIREAIAVSQLRHPNTAQVFDGGETENGVHFIVMEYLEGQGFDHRLAAIGRLDPLHAVLFIGQAAAALYEAHAKGIVHRDLKPGNFFIAQPPNQPEFLKVLDFGIAKIRTYGGTKELTRLTTAGSTMGTPHYMAPEQIRGEEVDARADIYSLGIILWEAITGTPPFQGDSPMEIFIGHLEQKLPKISTVVPEIQLPPGLDAIIAKALAKKPKERFANMWEFKVALDTSIANDPRALSALSQHLPPTVLPASLNPVHTHPSQKAVKRRQWFLASVIVATVALVGLLVVAIALLKDTAPEDAPPTPTPTAHIKILSEPPGAQIHHHGQILGHTPYHHTATNTEPFAFTLEDLAHLPLSYTLQPRLGEVQGLAAPLLPANADTHHAAQANMALWLESIPPGAEVYLDDNDTRLRTPCVVPIPLNAPPARISLRHPDFLIEHYRILAQPVAILVLKTTLIPR